MRLITACDVQRLTGLTADQLREWTARRSLIQPDNKPRGPGSRARYSWQTVLLLRLAVVMKQVFHIELHAQRSLFIDLAQRLSGTSFPTLRGKSLVVWTDGRFDIALAGSIHAFNEDALIIRLDPHLDVLSASFDLAQPDHQLPLFTAVGVR